MAPAYTRKSKGMCRANFAVKSVLGGDAKIYEVAIKAGNSLDRIAKTEGRTVEAMRKLNSATRSVRKR
jgi:hypothetical protein